MSAIETCAIAQPTFLPWLGWFDLADQADVMVILDDVPFSKQSWQQRNRIRTVKGLEFLTVPVKTSGRLGQRIDECDLADDRFANKMLKSIEANYRRTPFYENSMPQLSAVFVEAARTLKLAELNGALIAWMAQQLDVRTPMVRASTIAAQGKRGEHVAALCEHFGAKHYVSPPGAQDYLLEDRAAFDARHIAVSLQGYEHPQYAQQFQPFEPYACALDLIFNTGPEAPSVMRSGRRASVPLWTAAPDLT